MTPRLLLRGVYRSPSPDLRRALRRSRVRGEILVALLAFGRSTLGDIARLTGVEQDNLRGALFGDGEAYRVDHSLVFLGLVDPDGDDEVTYDLTPAGREVALELRVALMGQMTRRPAVRV